MAECDKCHGTGAWQESRYNPETGVRWVTRYCECPAGEAERQKDRLRTASLAWDDSGIPTRFFGWSLDSSPLLKANPALLARINARLSAPEDALGSQDSWLFWGNYGTGKTGLAAGIARRLVYDWGCNLLFRTLPDLMTELRGTYNRREGPTEQELLDKYGSVDALILDDLGAEQVKDTGWLEDRLYQIVGRRHGAELATIFTSNLSPAELGARIGERNMWRIVEMCGENIIQVSGRNWRDRHGTA